MTKPARPPIRWLSRLIALVSAALLGMGLAVVSAAPAQAATAYIYTTFKGDGAADQELWVYTSSDAANFSVLRDTNFRGPSGALRDPSIIKRDGVYYVAYTVQSWTTQSTHFNIARSTNLVDWTHVASVNAGVSGTAYTWAPEFYVEGSTVRVVVSLGTSDHQFTPYVYTAQNSGLTSWSSPTRLGIPTNHIDTYIVKRGSTYHAFVKNETSKWIERWTSTNFTSWTNQGNQWQQYHEGPSIVQLSNGTYRAYIDRYPSGGMWTSTSSDLVSWSGLSQVGCSGCRHGTVILDTDYTAPGGGASGGERVTNRHSGLVLDVQNPNTSNGAKVGQYAWNGGAWQQWKFEDAGSGYVRIRSVHSNKCLDVAGTANGAEVQQYDCHTGTNQQFTLRSTSNGYVQIVDRRSGRCLDVPGWSTANGTIIKIYDCNNGNNQQWLRAAA
ncbi:RICIN domain-containing protein [Agromyces intestinalis]|uniref:RICIN domain-containing protein n=1 Tax=Agromyces intestinalis TaxID=2592652 RepID=UPI00143D977C|nr:RICIN domain-containing protein [Agromyces intestinalis]